MVNALPKIGRGIPHKLVDRTPLNELLEQYCTNETDDHIILLYKIEIPVKESLIAYNTIQQLGYSAANLFPGYSGISRKMEEDRISQGNPPKK